MDLGHLEIVLDRLPEPVLLVGPDQGVLLANRLAVDLFEGMGAGRHLLSFVRQPDVLAAITEVLNGKSRAVSRYVSHRPAEAIYRVVANRLEGAESGIDGAVVTFSDITRSERAGELHSEFVANVSHELRSPLTALSGFIETLQGPAADDAEARQGFLATMQAEAERMRRLIDDLLSLSRVEVNERVRPTGQITLGALIGAVCSSLAPVARQNNVTLRLDTGDGRGDVAICADADEMTQVFQNLIENAIKYGPDAPIDIRLYTAERIIGVRGRAVCADITDHGAGIAALHIPRLTERFYRVDSHRSRDIGGTGLGLAIVKHIVQRHRGRLIITSTLGQGSTFKVALPID